MAKRFSKGRITASTDPEVLEYEEIFTYYFKESLPDLNRMIDLQRMYDNNIEVGTSPTVAQMSIPFMFNMVEKSIPGAMEYMFPEENFLRLHPLEAGVNMENIVKAETALTHTIRSRVRLQHEAVRTIKDCFKLSVGYGIIEPYTVTPTSAIVQGILGEGGEMVAQSRAIGLGVPKKAIRYRYIAPGQIIVTKDGNDFNGSRPVSISFFVDSYPEDQFRRMFNDELEDGEGYGLKGDPEHIIQRARDMGFHSRTAIVDIVAKLAGMDMEMRSADPRIPVQVPVVKVYDRGKHLWIANFEDIIFRQEAEVELLRCPLVKASAWPDGLRWYPMSPVEAAQSMSIGYNVWVSALFDLMTHYLKPTLIYDKQQFNGKAPERGPDAAIGAVGGRNVNEVASYMRGPDMPAQMFTVGDLLLRQFGDTVNQQDFLNNAQPGLLRSGAFAFESLLQQTTGRGRLIGAVLESGFLHPAIMQILALMQQNIGADGDLYRIRDWDGATGEEYIRDMTLTQEDLVNAFDLQLDLRAKHAATAVDASQRVADYDRGMKSQFTDKYEVEREFWGNDSRAKRLMKSKEQIRAIDTQNIALEQRERALGIQRAQQGVPSNQGDQAMVGAAQALGQ